MGPYKPVYPLGFFQVFKCFFFLKGPDGVSCALSVVVFNVDPLAYISTIDNSPVSPCYAEARLPQELEKIDARFFFLMQLNRTALPCLSENSKRQSS